MNHALFVQQTNHGSIALTERALTRFIELAAAALLTAVICLLMSGVIARYVLHVPLLWSDELISILFLWLAMLGASLATQRMAHMRMTAVVSRLGDQWSSFFEALAPAAAIAFLASIIGPAYHYAIEEGVIMTPALEISNLWRAAAMPAGIILMTVFSVLRIANMKHDRKTVAAIALVVVLLAAFMLASPLFKELGKLNLVIFFIGVVGVAVFSGVSIAVSFGLATLGFLALTTRIPLMTVIGRMEEGMSHLMLVAIPSFVFLGLLLEMTGMARVMVNFLASLLGHVRGGLSYALIGAMYLVSGISGSKAADMAAIAPALFPEMTKRGAKPGELAALLSATGAQTETVPPSIVLLTIGSVSGVSIAALFTGGLVPALVLGIGLCIVVGIRYRKEDQSVIKKAPVALIAKAFFVALPALALPFVIRAAVVEGIATASEVSIGIVYAIVAGIVIYRQFDVKRLLPMLIETAVLSGAILLIIATASAMAWALTQSGFSRSLALAMQTLPGGAAGFMVVSILAFIVLGSVLEGIPAVVLFGPLLFPIARTVGIHEVHYSMVIVLAMGLGLFAPPFGVGFYTACAITKIPPEQAMRPIWGYMFAMLLGLILIAAVPWLSIGFL